MSKKALPLIIILLNSPVIFANPSDMSHRSHHEAVSGGTGVIVGGFAGGPIGAIIGGSIGAMIGNNQNKSEQILTQQKTIEKLENDLQKVLSQQKQTQQQFDKTKNNLRSATERLNNKIQSHRADIIQFVNSYQFDIYFMTNGHIVNQHAKEGLLKLADLLENNKHIHAHIEAHSDWRGTDNDNCRLARQRLSAVTELLLQSGADQKQLLTTNYGEHASLHSRQWGEALFYDRRVTITLRYYQ